ncbi:glycosyltransferase family protein [Streptomyces melanogenes]|uniref:glycosyltransferase family protein n=1 Tax=Streptomyces melanogenes TaxID=67326 RepID=UPI00167EB5CC|nr:hypothetical protein [Streptomyces melanogenes]GGP86192.1 hypothetical protein GCM10010278_75690 [Streptomyces melanogenes]
MATLPLVLHISNERAPMSHACGFLDAFGRLADQGLLRHTWTIPAVDPADVGRITRTPVCLLRPDLVFVQTPQHYAWRRKEVGTLLRSLGSPRVVVWEGGAWGGLRRLQASSAMWLRHADVVYSVAMGPQERLLHRRGARRVRYVPHVAPLRFVQAADDVPVPRGLVLMGTRPTHGGIELVCDDRERRVLARELARLCPKALTVYGRGWFGPHARGPLPYDGQLNAIQGALVTAGWNRHRSHPGFYSDQLPIALCAGRVHISSRQPGLEWLPGADHGLHLADTPREAAALARDLLRADPADLRARAARGRAWARAHLTETHALRHMLAPFVPGVEAPSGPWADFG